MLEINRQFVIFGNFNSVSFEDIMKLEDIRKEYSLQINFAPDIIVPPPAGTRFPTESRPIFQTADKKFTVFFGTGRIHIEELEGDSESYNSFSQKAIKILNQIKTALNLNISRLAINGQVFDNNQDWINRIFQNTFKTSDFCSEASDEWQFRIRNIENLADFNCYANKIVSYARGSFMDNYGRNRDGLIAGYDYNTQADAKVIFLETDLRKFLELATSYREQFIVNCRG